MRQHHQSKPHSLAVGVAVPRQRGRNSLQLCAPAFQIHAAFVVVAAPAGREHVESLVRASEMERDNVVYLHVPEGQLLPAVGAAASCQVVHRPPICRGQSAPARHQKSPPLC